MNDKIIEVYYETLNKVCGLEKDEINHEIIDTRPLSRKGYRLLVENDYGEKVFEYVDGINYKSAKPKGLDLVNYDDDINVSSIILEDFGYGTSEELDIAILADKLANCEDWTYDENEDMKEIVVKHVSIQTNFLDSEISYLFDKFFNISPTDRLHLMDLEEWIKEKMGL